MLKLNKRVRLNKKDRRKYVYSRIYSRINSEYMFEIFSINTQSLLSAKHIVGINMERVIEDAREKAAKIESYRKELDRLSKYL